MVQLTAWNSNKAKDVLGANVCVCGTGDEKRRGLVDGGMPILGLPMGSTCSGDVEFSVCLISTLDVQEPSRSGVSSLCFVGGTLGRCAAEVGRERKKRGCYLLTLRTRWPVPRDLS